MARVRRIAPVVLTIAAVACFSGSCRRRPSDVKRMMNRLAGTWEWRQPNAAQPTVIVLELTARGKYEETTYREIGGQRKLLYMHPFTKDLIVQPEGEEAIAELEKERFQPAKDHGSYMVSLEENAQRIVFESASVARARTTDAVGVDERLMMLRTDNQLVIGGRIYLRRPTTPSR